MKFIQKWLTINVLMMGVFLVIIVLQVLLFHFLEVCNVVVDKMGAKIVGL
jgi:hypothetical protein